MARPTKEGLEYFPKWNPNWVTKTRIASKEQSKRYRALLGSSSAFVNKKKVREYIFKRDNYKCVFCGSKESLTVDHIISVYRVSKYPELIKILNTEGNLQTACNKCNAGKNPD